MPRWIPKSKSKPKPEPKSKPKPESKPKRYVIIRTYSAGCFVGYLVSRKGKEVVLTQARRLWYWAGAASLSQLAQSGTSRPQDCKFPEPVDRIELTEAIEVIDVTEKGKISIEGVPVWKV
jgi:hypothetical protein